MTGVSVEKKEMSMSSKLKPTGNESTETEAVRTSTAESPDGNSAHEEIRARAHEIYLGRGGQSGGEMDDWLQAERELAGSVRRDV
jgi:hypothetical protein